jgi:hypothetical protein
MYIWTKRMELARQRARQPKDAFPAYDSKEYYPALELLRQECDMVNNGHTRKTVRDWKIKREFWMCVECGASQGLVLESTYDREQE